MPNKMACLLFRCQSIFPRILETTPAGISRGQLQHFGQLINSGKSDALREIRVSYISMDQPKTFPKCFNL